MYAARQKSHKESIQYDTLKAKNLLIELYTDNLNSISILASILATLAFTGMNNPFDDQYHDGAISPYGYGYFLCFAISLVLSMLVMSLSVVAALYGPQLALLGHCGDEVDKAIIYMRDKQRDIVKYGALGVVMLFLGGACQAMENLVPELAYWVSLILFAGLGMIYILTHDEVYSLSIGTVSTFHHDDGDGGVGETVASNEFTHIGITKETTEKSYLREEQDIDHVGRF